MHTYMYAFRSHFGSSPSSSHFCVAECLPKMPKRKAPHGAPVAAPWKKSGKFVQSPLPPQASSSNSDGDRDFRHWLLNEYAEATLPATKVCGAAWHLGAAAGPARVDDLARNPKSQSGSFAMFLDTQLGLDKFEKKHVYWEKYPNTHAKGESP